MKAWGRNLPTTDTTQNLPKVFWIAGPGPTTCAIHVDVDSYNVWAVDNFRLSDVAFAADNVIAQCLIPKGKIGLAYPAGPDGHVHAKVWGSQKSVISFHRKQKRKGKEKEKEKESKIQHFSYITSAYGMKMLTLNPLFRSCEQTRPLN